MMKMNRKGIGLIELLIVIAVIALTAPLLFSLLGYALQSYGSYNRYMDQHYKVLEVTQRIRKDIEEAAAFKIVYDATVTPIEASILTLWIPDEDGDDSSYSIRIWKVQDRKLYYKGVSGTIDNCRTASLESADYEEVLGGLDTDTVSGTPDYMPTRFESIDDRIVLSIKPVNENTAPKNRNVTKPVVTEFSVRYKEEIN